MVAAMSDAMNVPPRKYVSEDRDGQHHAGDEPRPTLSASNAPGHHDHRDTGDGGERGRRLGHAEGEESIWTSWRRLRSGGVAVTMTLTSPSRKSSPLAQRRTVR